MKGLLEIYIQGKDTEEGMCQKAEQGLVIICTGEALLGVCADKPEKMRDVTTEEESK